MVRSFLGLVTFHQLHVPLFADLAAPLSDALHDDRSFQWTRQLHLAFNNIKSAITKAVSLTPPDSTLPFMLYCDASNIAISCAVYQQQAPIAFLARKLSEVERRYSVPRREVLAISFGLRKIRQFALGAPLVIYTDSRAAADLLNDPSPKPQTMRIREKLAEFGASTIHHIPSQQNGAADALSKATHLPEPSGEEVTLDTDAVICLMWSKVAPEESFCMPLQHTNSVDAAAAPSPSQDPSPPTAAGNGSGSIGPDTPSFLSLSFDPSLLNEVRAAYATDPLIIRHKIKPLHYLQHNPSVNLYFWGDGSIFDRLFIPFDSNDDSLITKFLSLAHDKGMHRGIRPTYSLLQRSCFWTNMYHHVAAYVRSCTVCARHKPRNTATPGELGLVHTPSEIFEAINMDHFDIDPDSQGFNMGLMIVCRLSRWISIIPCRKSDTALTTATRFFQEHVCRYGRIICDKDGGFHRLSTKHVV